MRERESSPAHTCSRCSSRTAAHAGRERAWQAGLLALGDPVSGSTGWSALLAAVNRELQGTVAQQEAAQRGDTAMFTKTFHDLTSYGLPGTQAAAAISLASCDPGNLANPNATAPVPVRRP